MKALIVIPSRYGSTRFPGKPLHIIAGHTLLERVVDLARGATRDDADVRIVVATDDARIRDHAIAIGCDAVMTDSAITSGTGRALAAARAGETLPGIVLNLQGDAPFAPPEAIRRLLETLRTTEADAATPVLQLGWDQLDALRDHKRRSPFSGTTCIRAADGRALWFSKTIIPAIRDEAALRTRDTLSPVFRHLGLYAYRLATLAWFEATPPSPYETLEGLEQLRLLELGVRMQTVTVGAQRIPISGIDTLEDAALAERLIAEHGDPFGGSVMTRIFVVRHGNTFGPGEPPRRVGAATDLPLVDSGLDQADALGRWFAGRSVAFTRVLSGPLLRTRQTAERILSHMTAPPTIEHAAWLREIDHGPDENQTEDRVIARIGKVALEAWDTHGTPPDGWTVDATMRIAAWRAFLAAPLPGDTLIVTSNGAARFAMLAWPDLSLGRDASLKIRTGAYGVIERDEDGRLRIAAWDQRPT